MIKSFLRAALRPFARHKGYQVLYLLGLIIGLSCCLFLFQYVAFERSFDDFHPHADRIYRVQESDYQNGHFVENRAATSPAVAPALTKEFPEIESACRLIEYGLLLSNDARQIKSYENRSFAADASVLSMFRLPLLKGDPATALIGVNKVILSEATARKYFGSANPIGQTLAFRSSGRTRLLEVTGVFGSLPSNSHLVLDVLFSYSTYSDIVGRYGDPNDPTQTAWGWPDFYTYIKLRPGTYRRSVEAKLPAFLDRHYNGLPKHKSRRDSVSFQLYPLADIHLYSHYTDEAEAPGDGASVSLLFLIAFLIAAVAWINAIHFATARSLERAREVGVRKVLGAARGDLVRQFLLESCLVNAVALLLALVITWTLHPLFNELTGRSLSGLPPGYWVLFAALFLAGTLISGLYPSLVLSRYDPLIVLQGRFQHSARGQAVRRGLIVVQFAVSTALIVGTITIHEQVRYMQDQPLGASTGQTVVLSGSESMSDSVYESVFPAFEAELLRTPGIQEITGSTSVIGQEIGWSGNWQRLDTSGGTHCTLDQLGVDDRFIGFYRLHVIAGRTFSRQFASDKKAVVLNLSAVKALGYARPQDAVGAWLRSSQRGIDTVQVIGVLADYHQEGLQKAIRPISLVLQPTSPAFYSIRLGSVGTTRTLAAIKKTWDRYFPADPFDYFFLDEFFNRQYGENQRFGTVLGLGSLLAITIACLGLAALSGIHVIQRTREIAIRKVLGASVPHLFYLLSRDFLALVALAFLLAVPMLWWITDRWLQSFAYRIPVSWSIFAAAGALAFSIALLTLGIQTLSATRASPVEQLRTDG